jgi:dihydrofolate reductase
MTRPGSHGSPATASGNVIWHVTMSLDGFIARPGDGMEWVFRHPGPRAEVEEVIRTTGALLVGRRSWEVGRRADAPPQARKPYGGAWSGPQFVLTHDPPSGPADGDVTFLAADVCSAVDRALQAAAGANVVLIGATVARQCLLAGLIDQILVHVAPVLLGDGVRLFASVSRGPVDLELLSMKRSGELTTMRYRVVSVERCCA